MIPESQHSSNEAPFYKQKFFLPLVVLSLLMIPLTLVISRQEQNLSSFAATQTYTAGVTTVGKTMDSGNSNGISATQVRTGGAGGALNSVSIYVGKVNVAPQNHMQVAVYSDNGANQPGSLLSASTSQVVVPNSWNTFPLNAVAVSANSNYWLTFNVDGNKTQYPIGSTATSRTAYKIPTAFGTWPSSFGSPSQSGKEQYSIYMTYSATSTPLPTTLPTATTAPSPTVLPTSVPVSPVPTTPPVSGGGNLCAQIPSTPTVKPTAANTGVPVGTVLSSTPPAGVTVTADSWKVTVDGTVIDSKDIQGKWVDIEANNVTIKNSRIVVPANTYWAVYNANENKSGLTVLNSEITSSGGASNGIITENNTTVCGVNGHGFENIASIQGNNIVFQGNYFHVNQASPSTNDPHNDVLEVRIGTNIKILGNNLTQTNPDESWQQNTSALYIGATYGDIDQVVVDGNWFGGGAYSLYLVKVNVGVNAVLKAVDVTNNKWYRNTYAYGTHTYDAPWTPRTWNNNKFEDNGQVISF